MILTAKDMCVQLGRYLGRVSGDLFVEADASTKGTIYAAQLPPKAHRLTPACSITPSPGGADDANSLTQRISIVLHAEAVSNQGAMALLQGYSAVIMPHNRPAVLTETGYTPGVIGVPGVVGTHNLWRMIGIELTNHPTPTPRSPGGLAVAEMAFDIHAVPSTVSVTEE